MASIILADGIQFLNGLEANRLSVIPDHGEPLWTRDKKKLYIGDGAMAGGIPVSRDDNVVFYEWTGHGRTLPASGIDSVISDGTTLTDAQAATAARPSFHIVAVPDANTIGFITSGIAKLPNSSLDAGQMYWLDPDNPNALLDAEPNYSVPVCKVLHKVGTAALVRIFDWRAHLLEAAAPGSSAATHWRVNTLATQGGGNFVSLDEVEFRSVAGVSESMPTANAFASSFWPTPANVGGYLPINAFNGSITGLTQAAVELGAWGSNTVPLPQHIGSSDNVPRTVVELFIRANAFAGHAAFAPADFDLERSFDNGVSWQIASSPRGIVWADGESKVFSV